MSSGTWRGIVGVVKPTYGSGSLVEFIRLLPEGVGCIPMYAGIKEHSERGYLGALETYNAKVAELAEIGVDLMHPEGGPPFMVRGYKAEQEIVGGWEAKYKIPIFTSGISQAEALRALGIKKFVGCTYFHDEKLNSTLSSVFHGRWFRSAWDGRHGYYRRMRQTRFQRTRSISISNPHLTNIQRHKEFICSARAHGRSRTSLTSENDLGVPVVHPVAARVWFVQKKLRVRNPIKGASRLLEELP